MNCPKCGIEWKCGCKSCSDRNVQGETLAIFSGDFASCGYCGLKMHHEEWADEEHRQYEGMKKMKDQNTFDIIMEEADQHGIVDRCGYEIRHAKGMVISQKDIDACTRRVAEEGYILGYKAGHASRYQEVDGLNEAIKAQVELTAEFDDRIGELQRHNEIMAEALKFYAMKENWTQQEYVPFHIALKAAVEDGATIECENGRFRYKNEALEAWIIDGWTKNEYSMYWHTSQRWRIIPKPKKVEFECNIKEGKFSDNSGRFPIIDYSRSVENELMHFIGKRTKVTIEEIEE